MDLVERIRRFNRFYTRRIGLLGAHLPGGDLTLPEGRVIYELASADLGVTAADLTRALSLDKGYMSRLLKRLADRGLIEGRVSPANARQRLLSLTPAGEKVFVGLDAGARDQAEALLASLDAADRQRLAASLEAVEDALSERPAPPAEVVLRFPQIGDLGWVTSRQAALYAQEYGWDWTYEALVASILGDFVRGFDPTREDAWIAARGGEVLGSIFLMRGDTPDAAKLRLLYVEPTARGLGLGRTLVDACIARARALGYTRLTLWTNDILTAARRIYTGAGFILAEENHHHSFGHDLVGQTWTLDLRGA